MTQESEDDDGYKPSLCFLAPQWSSFFHKLHKTRKESLKPRHQAHNHGRKDMISKWGNGGRRECPNPRVKVFIYGKNPKIFGLGCKSYHIMASSRHVVAASQTRFFIMCLGHVMFIILPLCGIRFFPKTSYLKYLTLQMVKSGKWVLQLSPIKIRFHPRNLSLPITH